MPADPEMIARTAEAMEPAFRDMGFVGRPRERREAMARAAYAVIDAERQPVSVSEAEARAALANRWLGGSTPAMIALDAYRDAILATEHERYTALVEAARKVVVLEAAPGRTLEENAEMRMRADVFRAALKAIEEVER